MTYTIKDLKRGTKNRGLLTTKMETIWTAIVTTPNGDWVGVSRWDDEDDWVIDCAFRANGYPVFSNGTGSRVTAVHMLADGPNMELHEMTESILDAEHCASINAYLDYEREAYGREAEEEMLGRPLFPNEY